MDECQRRLLDGIGPIDEGNLCVNVEHQRLGRLDHFDCGDGDYSGDWGGMGFPRGDVSVFRANGIEAECGGVDFCGHVFGFSLASERIYWADFAGSGLGNDGFENPQHRLSHFGACVEQFVGPVGGLRLSLDSSRRMSGNSRTGWWFSLPVPEGLEGTVWYNFPFGRKMVPEYIEGLGNRPLDTFLTMFEKLEDRCGGRVNHDECRDFYRDPALVAGLSILFSLCSKNSRTGW